MGGAARADWERVKAENERLRKRCEVLLTACKKSKAFVSHTLEFFGWGQFPHLEREVEQLNQQLAATIGAEEGGAT